MVMPTSSHGLSANAHKMSEQTAKSPIHTMSKTAWHALTKRVAMPILLCTCWAACMAAVACHPHTRYDEYQHTDAEGWDRDTVLCFDVAPVTSTDTYIETLNIRTDNRYPFRQLCLIVDQEKIPSHEHLTDTLLFSIYNDDGDNEGRGFSLFQNEKVFRFLPLSQGDSLHVTVRHDMRRHSIPGIHEVGLRLEVN